MKRIHKVEDVIPEVIPDVVDVAPEVNPDVKPEVKTKEEQNHNCDSCIKCKDDINFCKSAINLLILRHVENIQFI